MMATVHVVPLLPMREAKMSDVNAEAAALLRRAAERVERGWCQGVEARDSNGMPVDADDPNATSWCMLGALVAEAHLREEYTKEYRRAYDALSELMSCPPATYNDFGAHGAPEVAHALRTAAERLEAGNG